MRLRRLVDGLIGADRSDPAALATRVEPSGDTSRSALADAGHGDLDPHLFGEALVHYADTAPIGVADALAPTVTAASSVPFDPDLDPVTDTDTTGAHDELTAADDASDRVDDDTAVDGEFDPDHLDAAPAEPEPTRDDAYRDGSTAPDDTADGFGSGAEELAHAEPEHVDDHAADLDVTTEQGSDTDHWATDPFDESPPAPLGDTAPLDDVVIGDGGDVGDDGGALDDGLDVD